MDNTLFEFVDAQVMACKAVVERLGAGNKMDLFEYFLRNDLRFEDHVNISDYMRDLGISDSAAFAECCKAYELAKLEHLAPYEGICECLLELRGMGLKLAVVTDATRANTISRLERTGLAHFFDLVVTYDDAGKRKPSPDSIRLALDRLGLRPEDALFVGDSPSRDVAAGKAIGTETAYAAYGDKNYRDGGGDAPRADHVLNRVGEISRLVSGRTAGKRR